jgi:phosphohistidine phosphatase SixA
MTSDVPLSGTGKERAKALADKLKEQHIAAIYSTSFKRTVATVEPLSHITGDPIQFYNTDTLAGFISGLRKIHTGNVVIAGHSNTMGDIINRLSGKDYLQGNLPDSAYGDLFIVIKKGKKYTFRKEHFGQ